MIKIATFPRFPRPFSLLCTRIEPIFLRIRQLRADRCCGKLYLEGGTEDDSEKERKGETNGPDRLICPRGREQTPDSLWRNSLFEQSSDSKP